MYINTILTSRLEGVLLSRAQIIPKCRHMGQGVPRLVSRGPYGLVVPGRGYVVLRSSIPVVYSGEGRILSSSTAEMLLLRKGQF